MNSNFQHILSPGYIGNLEIPNRIVMAPIGSLNGSPEGHVTQRTIDYYYDRAKGGTGLIVVESTYPDELASKGEDGQLGASNNSQTPGLRWLADAIHGNYGTKCALQLNHMGQQMCLSHRLPSWGPSEIDVMWAGSELHIHGMTKEEIHQLIHDFASAARRAQMAGFDAVEIHAANGHLYNMFLTPRLNKRTDEYGGSVENMMRIVLETIEEIRKTCGKDFPILVRLCGNDYDDDEGITLEHGIATGKLLDAAGVAAIDLVGGSITNGLCTPTMYDKLGTNVPIAEAFKKAGVRSPIIIAGGITKPELAEEIIAKGQADFIGLARPLLADPNWVNKLEEGRREDIVPCIRCGMGCIGTMEEWNASKGLRCAVNPRCSLEGLRKIEPLKRKKKVAIIGGGPAGMEAARVAKIRGHDVTLYEKRKLGGAMHEANWDPNLKADIQELINYYICQMKKADIRIINEKADADVIVKGAYDAVVVATGAVSRVSQVPGHDKPNVFDPIEVTGGQDNRLGERVIIVGGGVIGAEIAVSQAMKGKKVTLVTRRGLKMGLYEIAADDSSCNQMRIISMLQQYDVDFVLACNLKEITDDGIIAVDCEGNSVEVKGDSIVLCSGFNPDTTLYKELQGKVKRVYAIGDCVKARFIGDAINEGWLVANQL
jgi:2,4-dienoyl-CoA reductase-like NADH-dependent reductase (Old Yellow Enzyme family)/thioredoxin reductase